MPSSNHAFSGHNFNPEIIRAYDIRGRYGTTLHSHDARALGRVLGTIIGTKQPKVIVVGRDGRHSSPILHQELCHGLALGGHHVMDIGLVTTPLAYFATLALKATLGVMVTGSHNAADYNGFKIMMHGRSFYGQELIKLAERAKLGGFPSLQGQIIKTDVKTAYQQRMLQALSNSFPNQTSPRKSPRPLKIGWDCGNGASGAVLRTMLQADNLKQLNLTHDIINEKIDGDFPSHPPDPTIEANLSDLKKLVLKNSLDIGVAFDGDGDRVCVIDAKGRSIQGDQLLCLLAASILPLYPRNTPVIFDVKASDIVEEVVTKLGGIAVMSPSGHSIIKSKLAEINAPLAGEMSGHIIITHDYFGFDDALYAALWLIHYLTYHSKRLDELVDELPFRFNTPEIIIKIDEAKKFALIDEIAKAISHYDPARIIRIDGLRVKEDGGWWLVRASNTTAAITLRIEANDEKRLSEIKDFLYSLLQDLGVSASAVF